MKRLLERLLERRAEALACRLAPFLADCGSALDIGCGTGHNAAALRALCPQLAVCDLAVDTTAAALWATPEIAQILDSE